MFPFLFKPPSLRARLENGFKRCKLYIDLGNSIDLPNYRSIKRTHNGFTAHYQLPKGIHLSQVQKAVEALQIIFNADIEYYTEGRDIRLNFYTNKIPEDYNFNDSFLTPGEFAPIINIGIGRRGMESIDFMKVANPMMFILGAAGYGKTKCVESISTQLLYQDCELYIGDPKLDYGHFKSFVKDHKTEPLEITKMVVGVSDQIKTRIQMFKDAGTDKIMEYNQITDQKAKYMFLIVDEVLDFPVDNKDFWQPLSRIARMGRSAGIYVLFVLHRAANDMFPLDIRNNISNRIVMRVENPSDSEIGLGDSAAYHLPPIAGRAIFKQERLRQVQIPYISKDQVRAIMYAKRQTQEAIPDGASSH